LDSTFVEHPELQPYFWEHRPVDATTDEKTARTVEAIADQRVDDDEYTYDELLNMNVAPSDRKFVLRTPDGPKTVRDDWLAWSETIVGHFRTSPAMCSVVTDPEKKKTYGGEFINALAAAQVCPGLEGYSD
jgi:hypothetical protein